MRRWLRGKGGGFLGLLVITALVIGGLGWVTSLVLRLEEQQQQTLADKERHQAETAHVRALRLALWRLDEHVYGILAKEGNRPYHDYTAHVDTVPAGVKSTAANKALTVLELLLTRADDAPSWMRHSYLAALEADWTAPHALREDLVRHLNVSRRSGKEQKKAPADDPVLAALNRNELVQEYLHNVRKQEQDVQVQVPLLQNAPPNSVLGNNRNERADFNRARDLQNQQQLPANPPGRGNLDPDTMARISRGGSDKTGAAYQPPAAPASPEVAKSKDDRQAIVILGPLKPLWLREQNDDLLVLARLVQIGRKPACQVTLLDWSALEKELAGMIQDLLPEAALSPKLAQPEDQENKERAMTALPVTLDPGPVRVPTPPWDGTSLRYGLAVAWAASLVALLAVALGGWALLDLSERRIRFVSAVTHELRTPLTSLRLYLDMLTSGLVTEEKQKDEYLHTLNSETDRLNRLVSNVLDFSRLENQRPKLSLSYVTVSDLLYQVRTTWEGRCQDCGKELVVEDSTSPETLLHTDEQMVQQILCNLIDNACKYSRGAEDPRIWVRAREESGWLLLEVEDRGPGVALREQKTIFRAFRRGRGVDVTAGGVGLGLALAQRWAKLLSGSVTLESTTTPVGACFRVVLPAVSA